MKSGFCPPQSGVRDTVERQKERQSRAQTVDGLVRQIDRFTAHLRLLRDDEIAERALKEERSELQRELLRRQRERNRQDSTHGRAPESMSNTPLPPTTVRAPALVCDLEAMR